MALAGVLSLVVYILAVRSQNGLPAWWFFALMCLISIAAAVSSVLNQRRQRRAVLAVATAIPAALGVITLTSIGGPLILTAPSGWLLLPPSQAKSMSLISHLDRVWVTGVGNQRGRESTAARAGPTTQVRWASRRRSASSAVINSVRVRSASAT